MFYFSVSLVDPFSG